MIKHPLLALNFVPFNKVEMLLKRQYEIEQKNGDEALFLASISPAQRENLAGVYLDDPIKEEQDWTIAIERQLRYKKPRMHWHYYFELLYCMSGNCVVNWEDRPIRLQEGDILFLLPETFHSPVLLNSSILISIFVNPSFFTKTSPRFLLKKNQIASFFLQGIYRNDTKNYIKCSSKNIPNVSETIEKMALEHLLQKEYDDLLRDTYFSSVLNYIIRDGMDKLECGTKSLYEHPLIPQIQMYLQEHIQTATLQSTADYLNYSPSHIRKTLREKTGRSFSATFRRIKLDRACILLSGTKLSIGDITAAVGYENQRQFNRIFKENFGCTPSSYRTGHSLLGK